jgi:DNA-directed RNA polymerase specialized sigma24 family protein
MARLLRPRLVYNTHERTRGTYVGFEEFFLDHRDRLFAVLCVITGNRHDAEELAQDAFVTMWGRWDRQSSLDDPAAHGRSDTGHRDR